MAAFMLLIWPIVTLILFAYLGPLRGLIWATMAGYLFLPSRFGFVLPGIPDYAKVSAVSFSLVLAAVIFRHRLPPAPPRVVGAGLRNAMIAMAVIFAIGAVFTFLDNRMPFTIGGTVREGLGPRDVVGMISQPIISFVPFFLALRWIDRPDLHRNLLVALTLIGLAYGLLILFEWRMSPQLNNWVYGYFAHGWIQHVRGSSFRAIVFLEHGLSVGFFLFSAVLAALGAALASKDGRSRTYFLAAAGALLVTLVLSLNFGALLITVPLAATLLFLGRRMALWVAAGLSATFLILPALRQAGLLPLDAILAFAARIDPDRAGSLGFRLENEDALLAHALQKPFFGWGGWGRSRILDDRGVDTSVVDGLWIIFLGEIGWVGYLCYFGLLALPILILPFLHRRREIGAATVAIALIGAGNFIYIIPNAVLTPISFLLFGSLAGLVLHSYRSEPLGTEVETATDALRDPVGYTRFPDGTPPRSVRMDGQNRSQSTRPKAASSRSLRPSYSRRPE